MHPENESGNYPRVLCWIARSVVCDLRRRDIGGLVIPLLLALIQTPHRFRTKRQLWAYSGLALETRISAEYSYVKGQLRRSKKLISIRGLK